MTGEIWKDIEGFDGIYQVSNQGRVKRLPKEIVRTNGWGKSYKQTFPEKIIKPYISNNLWFIQLYRDGQKKGVSISRLVANAFLPKVMGKTEIRHIDGNNQNDRVDNLEWVTWGEKVKTNCSNNGGHNKRKVIQMDENGNTVGTYESIRKAAEALSVSDSCIVSVLKGRRKRIKGYVWKYANP